MGEREFHDRHYDRDAARLFESPLFGRVHDRAAQLFLRTTGADRTHRVLSLGCGDGSLELRLAPFVGEIVGVDISEVAIARARARAGGLGNAVFLAGDAPLAMLDELGSFDTVAAFAFLHHLDDAAIRETLHGVRRALRSRGVFYSTDPSRRRLVRLFAGLVRGTYDRYHSPDERELDPEAVAATARAAGFSQVAVGYTDFFLGPLAWLTPGTPRWLVPALAGADHLALRTPFLGRYASSFSLLARVA